MVALVLLVAVGLALVLYSVLSPIKAEQGGDEAAERERRERPCPKTDLDTLFQHQFHHGMGGGRAQSLHAEIRELTRQAADTNDRLHALYGRLRDEDPVALPDGFEALDYQFGEKLTRVPFEDRHRSGTGVPSFEAPTFVEL